MDRLSPLDAEFLHLEDGLTHLHIAGVSIFEGPAPSADELVGLLAAKLHRIPRYRQRVRSVPLELGRPVWVDDPHFLLDYHVRHTALPAPGDDATLRRLMGRLMSQPLDRDRPLWESWLVEGLEGDRWALISKVHHCMVDGISGVDLLAVLLDVERDVELPDPEPWEPDPEPSGLARVVDAWAGAGTDLAARARRLPAAVLDPAATARSLGGVVAGVAGWGRHLGSTPPLAIEGTIGPHRRWTDTSVTLADVRTIREAFGGTVNDVVLTALTAGYRSLVLAGGDDPADAVVRTLVPVSVRRADQHDRPDNRVSALLLELPVDVDDPLERLAVVRARMGDLKASGMAEAGQSLTELADLAPPMLLGVLSRTVTRAMHSLPQRAITTVTTNVPGPQFPLYCLGREMLEYRPYVPIAQGVRVGTAILSYNGRLSFGVTADLASPVDPAVLAERVPDAVAELVALAG